MFGGGQDPGLVAALHISGIISKLLMKDLHSEFLTGFSEIQSN